MARIEELSQKYEYNWGKEIDYTGISQDRLVTILERIVEIGKVSLSAGKNAF